MHTTIPKGISSLAAHSETPDNLHVLSAALGEILQDQEGFALTQKPAAVPDGLHHAPAATPCIAAYADGRASFSRKGRNTLNK